MVTAGRGEQQRYEPTQVSCTFEALVDWKLWYFSELEKSILLALVEKCKYVLERKESDARTPALKQRTWQALAHEYNSQPSVSLRDFKQLKKCWENIKARTKKIMAHERREKVKRSVSPLLSTHVLGKEKIASMLPEQLYFLQSPPEEEPARVPRPRPR
ncbi:transmembrane protein with EGF-like and two follistatin-like domains 1 [Camelus ferus]|nr:transmembrane protein with EGF-like and two follistatin-like domains 1 [Camelus ferus]